MKKMLTVLGVCVIASIASADLTEFRFKGEAQVQGVASDNWSMLVFGGSASGLSGLVSDNSINLDDMLGLGLSKVGSPLNAKPVFKPEGYMITEFITGDSSLVGDVFGLLVGRTGVTSVDDIALGDFVALTSTFAVEELRAAGPGSPVTPSQDFSVGTLNAATQVIPEPATVGLLGVAGLGMFLARRKVRS